MPRAAPVIAMVLPWMLSMRPNFTRVKFRSEVAVFALIVSESALLECDPAVRVRHLSDVRTRESAPLRGGQPGRPAGRAASGRARRRIRDPVRRHRARGGGYPVDEFAAPGGGLLIGLLDDQPVTGGAFRRLDESTAELKRIWTDSRHRRQGHAKALLARLEAEIVARGYRRVYLTTGDRQPEAEALYLSTGYLRLAEPLPAEGEVYPIAFQKTLA
jgi:GNAT superfamily N-acetyltransferase